MGACDDVGRWFAALAAGSIGGVAMFLVSAAVYPALGFPPLWALGGILAAFAYGAYLIAKPDA